jgi:hypothetical protein
MTVYSGGVLIPLNSCVCLLFAWLAYCLFLVPVGWDLLWSLAQAWPVAVAPCPAVAYPSFDSGSLSSLALRLSALFFPGLFFISWALEFPLAGSPHALPLLLLFFSTITR